jgi:hypothetical protein
MQRQLFLLVLGLPMAAVMASLLVGPASMAPLTDGDGAAPPARGAPAEAEPGRGIDAAPRPVQASTTAVDGYIAYPDGTWLPPLNGVERAPPMRFHDRAPFAPVVGLHRDATGRDWYEHENGVRSTTWLDSRGVALALVARPTAARPVLPDDR